MSDKERRIRARAYEIYEQEGRHDGRAEEHWQQAKREIPLIGDYGQVGRTRVFGAARTAVGPRRMPRTALPSPADGDRTRANQREALVGVLPLERRDQLAALLTDQGSRHRARRRKNALFAERESGAGPGRS